MQLKRRGSILGFCLLVFLSAASQAERADGQFHLLQQRLLEEDPETIAADARRNGDARRGAIVFYQPFMACTQCHLPGQAESLLGPDLTRPDQEVTDVYLVQALLRPSQVIKEGFETVMIFTVDGQTHSGLLESEGDQQVVLRDASRGFQPRAIAASDIEQRTTSETSIMPEGQVNQLASRQQFLDLVRYLIDIREGGLARARELEPLPGQYAARPIPEYENEIDHAGMIQGLDQESFRRGKAIYNRLCINCHGTRDRPGSLPTSLRFATGKFKSGNDPFTMYQTLTRGFGMMVPQAWMVPQQKYDVIHYIRQAYLKLHNADQYFQIDGEYLASLPRGTSRGPSSSDIVPWQQMDYGPNLVATYEIGDDGSNFAYKGNAIRLDHGPGGVSHGRSWAVFDYDTMRLAAVWSGEGFIDWNGINFNGRHQVHPRIVGQVHYANPTGPGWADPRDGGFDDPRLRGRDGRAYGPLPREWARYEGMYYHGNDTIIAYRVGQTSVLEMPRRDLVPSPSAPQPFRVFSRVLNIGPRDKRMVLQVAKHPRGNEVRIEKRIDVFPSTRFATRAVVFAPKSNGRAESASPPSPGFDGKTFVQLDDADGLDMRDRDYSVYARMKTSDGGTIFAKTEDDSEWVPNGKALFIRGGKVVFDVGWVGAVRSSRRINDNQWHDVAMSYRRRDGEVRLYVDGRLDGVKRLQPRERVEGHVARIGYAAPDFPKGRSMFRGEIREVRFFDKVLSPPELAAMKLDDSKSLDTALRGHWRPAEMASSVVRDLSGHGADGQFVRAEQTELFRTYEGRLAAGVSGDISHVQWQLNNQGNLRLAIEPGKDRLRLKVWLAEIDDSNHIEEIAGGLPLDDTAMDLWSRTRGGPPRWSDHLTTHAVQGESDGPFAVDVLTRPTDNPWFCRTRLTGLDFVAGGDQVAVCSWDGNVWMVSGLSGLDGRPSQAAQSARTQSVSTQSASTQSSNTLTGSGLPSTTASLPAVRTLPADSKADSTVGVDPPQLRWRRIASGLFQPLGLKVVDGRIYVTCRDQICILHDLNDDGEIDFYENLNNDHQVTDHFHEFAMGLQTDEEGNFYYAKSARHALPALVPHHGTLLRVSQDGSQTQIVANGFRAANGVCINADGTFIVTDQEGHWNPKNRINWVERGGFYGNMFGYHDVTDSSDTAMLQPLCWVTNAFDRSPSELLWVDSQRWGPLDGSLLNFSYGYGKVYVVPHEEVAGQKQGGMCELPLPQFPTGIMRGRFHPGDGQLYACGMFAWAGSQQQPGGLYRIRYTGRDVYLPIGLHARRDGMEIQFSGRVDRETSSEVQRYRVKVWSLKRTANYGSQHYNERQLPISDVLVSPDAERVLLRIPELAPTWCMEISYDLQDNLGRPVKGVIHNTVHNLSR